MSKLIDQIQNYPYSAGSVAESNRLLLDGDFMLKSQQASAYLKQIYAFSRDIYFFNELGTNSNHWQEMLRKDEVFQLLLALHVSPSELHTFFTELPQSNNFNNDDEIQEAEYETLAYQRFQVIQYMFWLFRDITTNMQADYQHMVQQLLKEGNPVGVFPRFISLYKECFNNSNFLRTVNRLPVGKFSDISFPEPDEDMINTMWTYFDEPPKVDPVLVIYSNKYDKLKAANEHLFNIFRSLVQTLHRFQQWAKDALETSLNKTNTHEPHISLLIVFSKLLSFFDSQYNHLVQENTEFIYNKILGLKKQPTIPDTALINLELAKNVSQHFLPEGSLFKAGKNASNKPVYYKLEKDTVLNGAEISTIKSSVRIRNANLIKAVTGTQDATAEEWKVNGAWLPFNDLSEAYTGLAIESRMLLNLGRKNTVLRFNIKFESSFGGSIDINKKIKVELLLDDGAVEILKPESALMSNNLFSIEVKMEKELSGKIRKGINTRILLLSPGIYDEVIKKYIDIYQFFLNTPIIELSIRLYKENFIPDKVRTSSGTFDGSASFVAFGTRSRVGASFLIMDDLLEFVTKTDIQLTLSEKLDKSVLVTVSGEDNLINYNDKTPLLKNCITIDEPAEIEVKLSETLSEKKGKVTIPIPIIVKKLKLMADLREVVFGKNTERKVLFIENISSYPHWITPLKVSSNLKLKLKQHLYKRFINYREIRRNEFKNNKMAQVFPLGEVLVRENDRLTFLPDYSKLDFNKYHAELCIGLKNIRPGQSISLLIDIAEETAGQSLNEPRIEWFYVAGEIFNAIDIKKLTDTTRNFLQTGLVQLTLPEDATHTSSLISGEGLYWLVARCDHNYNLTANVKGIYMNGLKVKRQLDEENEEGKRSVPAFTIQNLYPKTANIKLVQQPAPSQGGREPETSSHYFDRVSKRLRHKNRAVQQWDVEQLILEQFSFVFKAVCLNHAEYKSGDNTLVVSPAHTLVLLLPFYPVYEGLPRFRPAIAMSKLIAVENWLKVKSSPFIEYKVINAPWDEIKIDVNVMLNKGYADISFYKARLNTDIQKFISPWAFLVQGGPAMGAKLYAATLIDYIDELEYVHHIISMRMFRNDDQFFDFIETSSAIHLFTSVDNHEIDAIEYDH